MDAGWLSARPGGVTLTVKATPRASADGVAGCEGDWLRVRLRAPPVDGKANAALLDWLARTLGVPRRAVCLAAGESGRIKRVHVAGLDPAQVRARLGV